jgi:peptidoglycan-associated lipoprotein
LVPIFKLIINNALSKETKFMRFEKLIKGLAFGLAVSLLAACSSTETMSDSEASEQAKATETTSSTATPVSDTNSGVMIDSAGQVGTAQDQQQKQQDMERKYQELRQSQVVYFDFDKSDIRQEFIEVLEAHAVYLRNNPSVTVLIEGHTDERGTPAYNIALGESRAKAVARYLQSLGVLASQISTVSYGEEKPVDMTHTSTAWTANRRAVLVY